MKPPLYALLRGAWIGCLLIALFLVVRAMRSDRQSPGRMLRHGGRVLLTGLVTSTIAILLLQRLSDIGLPITLEVNDWIGGLIVGLIAYGSTDLLYKRLAGGGSDENPTDARGTAEY